MDDIENEGYQAFWSNDDINPYRRDSEEHTAWAQGYHKAVLDCDEYWGEYHTDNEFNVLGVDDDLYPGTYHNPYESDDNTF